MLKAGSAVDYGSMYRFWARGQAGLGKLNPSVLSRRPVYCVLLDTINCFRPQNLPLIPISPSLRFSRLIFPFEASLQVIIVNTIGLISKLKG